MLLLAPSELKPFKICVNLNNQKKKREKKSKKNEKSSEK